MFVCVTMALAQHDFKRLLAYHSISQIGYVLTAVGLCTGLGFSAGLYHAMNHTLFKGLLFLAAGAVLYQTGTTDLDELGGAFSISGLPPFNGFASKWMIYQATYEKAAETGNIGFLLVTVIALVTSVLTLASFVKVSQSVFFGRLPAKFENVTEVRPGMIIAMCIFAVLCVVTRFVTEPAARAAFSVVQYIDAMMGTGYAATVMGEDLPIVATVSFTQVGYWSPVSWLLVLCITLLAVTIVAVSARYDCVSQSRGEAVEAKYDLFFGGERASTPRSAGATSSGASSITGGTISTSCTGCTAASSTTMPCGRLWRCRLR